MANDKKTLITCTSMQFSELYYTGCFTVPWHQRSYDWGETYVEDFLRDTHEAMKEGHQCYFMSSIILVPNPDEENAWEINDGQQRMITFSLICARLCRLFAKDGEGPNEAYTLRILFNLSGTHQKRLHSAENLAPRITPSAADEDSYYQIIRGEDIDVKNKLTDAWKKIDQYIIKMPTEEMKSYFNFYSTISRLPACVYQRSR